MVSAIHVRNRSPTQEVREKLLLIRNVDSLSLLILYKSSVTFEL